MALNIRDDKVNQLAEALASRQHITKTDAVKRALENELRRIEAVVPLRERMQTLPERILSRPATGLAADKAFYDDLSGDT